METFGNQPITIQPEMDITYMAFEPEVSGLMDFIRPAYEFIANPKLWNTVILISSIISVILLFIIIFSLVRIIEMQKDDRADILNEIKKAELRKKEREKSENPRWHYILTLIESPNDSDWRVAIMEADSMLEEVLRKNGAVGNTLSELLDYAKNEGYRRIQDAWDAHIVRNKIAHEGIDFPVSQVEGRKVIKMYQNFFEEMGVIKA